MADHLETERKYEADASLVLPSFAGLPGVARVDEPRTYLLSATYFDTPDLRLLARRMTLRRRSGGPDEGWHLKLPAGQDTRKELQEPLGAAGSEQVPPRLAAEIGELPVAPVALLETERTVRHLYDHAGRQLAEVADDLVTGRKLAQNGSEPVRWREIEIETTETELLDACARLLISAGARPGASPSKVARVLRVLASSEPFHRYRLGSLQQPCLCCGYAGGRHACARARGRRRTQPRGAAVQRAPV